MIKMCVFKILLHLFCLNILHMMCVCEQIAAILTLPFDVVKTRRQIQLGEMDSLGGVCSNITVVTVHKRHGSVRFLYNQEK